MSRTSELASYPGTRSYVQAAVDGVLRAGFRPMDMSYFSARDENAGGVLRASRK